MPITAHFHSEHQGPELLVMSPQSHPALGARCGCALCLLCSYLGKQLHRPSWQAWKAFAILS